MPMLNPALLLPTLAAFLAAIGMAIPQQPATQNEDQDRAAISQFLDRFLDAWNKHDVHAFALLFAEDADFTNVAGTHAQGRAAIEAFHTTPFATMFKDSHQTAKIRSIRFLRLDLAAVDVDWELTGARDRNGNPRPYRKGLINSIMARQENGAWLFLIVHNTDLTDILGPPK